MVYIVQPRRVYVSRTNCKQVYFSKTRKKRNKTAWKSSFFNLSIRNVALDFVMDFVICNCYNSENVSWTNL